MAKETTYEQVAVKEGLTGETRRRYLTYMRFRWNRQETHHCRFMYAHEWARRFRDGREYECSDTSGRIVLNNVVDYEAPLVKNY